MSGNDVKKKALLAYKAKILQDFKYYEDRIQDARANLNKTCLFENGDSSDSDTEFPLQIKPVGSSVRELKDKERMLKTCLQATQELTSLEVLESEVNIMVEDPVLNGESPVKEEGVWREVIAECCVDLVPFSITFYAHKPTRKFGPISYRSLRVVLVKGPHEAELAKSVLPGLVRPSDAVEVLRSYAVAHRSRRSTLARLADKFAGSLFMEPLPEGGYLLKCANLLELQWTLQNKWSPIAPFHHRMKFDLEYMDKSYIEIITQAHRQLSDPEVDTDERTLLLSNIIRTCLEAQGPTQELYDSLSSDPETKNFKDRRTTLDREPEVPVMKKKKKDDEVMAPPKSLPKKVRPKSKASDGKKEGVKRSSEDNAGSSKKMKVSDKVDAEVKKSSEKQVEAKKNTVEVVVKGDAVERTSVASAKTGVTKAKTVKQVEKSGDNVKTKPVTKNNDNLAKTKMKVDEIEKTKSADKNHEKAKNVATKDNSCTDKEKETSNNVANSKSYSAGRNHNPNSVTEDNKNVASTKNNDNIGNKPGNTVDKTENVATDAVKVVKKTVNKVNNDGKVVKNVKKVVSESEATKKVVKKVASDKIQQPIEKKFENNVPDVKTAEGSSKIKAAAKNVADAKNTQKPNTPVEKPVDLDKAKKTDKVPSNIKLSNNQNIKKVPLNIANKPKISNTKVQNAGNTNFFKAGNIEKENNSGNLQKVSSKIMLKSKLPLSSGIMKKLPLRVSPRKLVSKIKSPIVSKAKPKNIQKPVTSIPRLMNKPKPKIT